MKTFHCNRCSQLVFFENIRCERCDALLGYLPEHGEISAFEPADVDGRTDLWRSLHPDAQGSLYRMCDNYAIYNVCNWMVPDDEPHRLCRSCELTRTIPNLTTDENRTRWYKLEGAKRRLLYTLAALRLPIEPKRPVEQGGDVQAPELNPSLPTELAPPTPNQAVSEMPSSATAGEPVPMPLADHAAEDPDGGVAFEFLENTPDGDPVLTGHDNGLITLNIAEADDSQREKVRAEMHEPYRTLLGHFRHEIGHYYFDRLVADTRWTESFRAMFGDERMDYGEALQQHYQNGAPVDWPQSFISAYATTHPWEDWAETWAHYLHMVDTLDTATSCGLTLLPDDPQEPTLSDNSPVEDANFDNLMKRWFPLTYALNSLNRSLGMPDGYPFTLAPTVVEKLRFVHHVVAAGVLPKTLQNAASPVNLEQEMLGS
jgi:hypothetical protein